MTVERRDLRKVAVQGLGTAIPNRRQWRQRLDKSAPTAPHEGRLARRVRAERRWPQLTAGESADRRGLRSVGRCPWRRHRAGCGPSYDYAPTDWRAGCGRSARPVRREGRGSIPGPYLYPARVGERRGREKREASHRLHASGSERGLPPGMDPRDFGTLQAQACHQAALVEEEGIGAAVDAGGGQ
jgi:hypothetical protein